MSFGDSQRGRKRKYTDKYLKNLKVNNIFDKVVNDMGSISVCVPMNPKPKYKQTCDMPWFEPSENIKYRGIAVKHITTPEIRKNKTLISFIYLENGETLEKYTDYIRENLSNTSEFDSWLISGLKNHPNKQSYESAFYGYYENTSKV